MVSYQTKSPILLLIFNRPDLTLKVFEQIRKAQPPKLYVAADGPRDKPEEAALCNETRQVINKIDWNCEVKILFREQNLGCKQAVSSAIDWFFSQEEEGIILEDDCLPSNSFFYFCDTLLEKYRFDTRIRHISGSNFQYGKTRGDASYYFSNLTHVWGWASWKRVWQEYDKELSWATEEVVKVKLKNIFNDPFLIEALTHIFSEVKSGRINTWDYQLAFLNFFNHGLSVMPNKNLISNIGYGPDATHSTKLDEPNSNLASHEISDITHPPFFLPEKEADYFTLSTEFQLAKKWNEHNLLKKQFKRWIKTRFKK